MTQDYKDLAAMADEYYETRETRLSIEKEAEEMKKKEMALAEALVTAITEGGGKGVAGKVVSLTVKQSSVPRLANWDATIAYCVDRNDFSILQRRISETAVRERWDAGEVVAGVEVFRATKLSIHKL